MLDDVKDERLGGEELGLEDVNNTETSQGVCVCVEQTEQTHEPEATASPSQR